MCRFLAVRGVPEAVQAFLEGPIPLEFKERSRRHTAGWGVAWYQDGQLCRERAPVWIREDETFPKSRAWRGDTVILHMRRATRGGIAIENTHPFVIGNWAFAHNGTIINAVTREIRAWLKPACEGQTDSETFFFLLKYFIDFEGCILEGTRQAVRWVFERSPTARLNFVLSNGKGLYAFRRGHSLYAFVLTTAAGEVHGVSSDLLVPGSSVVQRDWLVCWESGKLERRLHCLTVDGLTGAAPEALRAFG